MGTITAGSTLSTVIPASDTKAYTLTATISDKIATTGAAMALSNGAVPMDFLKGGKGIAVGKTATREGLDIAFPIYVESRKVYVDGKTILDKFFPIGKMWISTDPTSPASIVGGSWEQIQDRFLLAAGSTYGAGTTGGEAAHTLTIDEMPAHGHDSYDYTVGFMAHKYAMSGTWAEGQILATISTGAGVVWTHQNPPKTGGGGSHNNMPPYLSVYMWKRVS